VPLYFNTAGPCRPERHYMIPALRRLPSARPLVERGFYFVVHAPRQAALTAWVRACRRPLALFFDEIDSLSGQSLEAVLRQLRAGYDDRPGKRSGAPWLRPEGPGRS
jgi:hypothetical protein